MINIPKFDDHFLSHKFKNIHTGTVYVCVGYGENQGSAYLIGTGAASSAVGAGAVLRTFLLKDIEFVS